MVAIIAILVLVFNDSYSEICEMLYRTNNQRFTVSSTSVSSLNYKTWLA